MIDIKVIQTLDVYVFALMVLILISIKALNNPNGKGLQARAFSILIILNFFIIFVDSTTILFDGIEGFSLRILLLISMVFGYCLQVLICLFWYWYAQVVIFPDRRMSKLTSVIQGLPAFACIVIAIASCWTGWFFWFDEHNVYQRGPVFSIIAITSFLYLFFGYVMILRNREKIVKRHFIALLSFVLPPSIGGLLQTFLYGVSLLWPSMTISILIIYLAIQNELLLLDYLTGINNRMSFDFALRRRIMTARESTPFALMLLDINNFSSMNDRYGRVVSDEMLKIFAKILTFYFRHNGFVARYGGDEFAVIIEIGQVNDLLDLRGGLQAQLEQWNEKSGKPWNLSVSIGCAPYIVSEKMSQDNFMVQVDKLLSLDRIVPGERRFHGRRSRARSSIM